MKVDMVTEASSGYFASFRQSWHCDLHMSISKGPVGNVRASLAVCHSSGPCKGYDSKLEQLFGLNGEVLVLV